MHNYIQSGNFGASSCEAGLQDCKETLFTFQQTILSYYYILGFSLLVLQLINLLVTLLCDYRLKRYPKEIPCPNVPICRGFSVLFRLVLTWPYHRTVERVQQRRPAHLLQARAQARALLLNIEDLIRYGQPRAHQSGSHATGG